MDRNDTTPPVATTDVGPRDTHDPVNDPATFRARPTAGYTTGADIEVGQNRLPVRNRVQWGPILAGVVTTAATMLVLSVLGLALGASVLDRNVDGNDLSTGATIWGIISALIAFFVGGWVAARSAAVGGTGSGLLNGLMAGCATLVLLLALSGLGLGDAFGVTGANFDDIINASEATFSNIEDEAWWTLIGLLAALGAAAVGGLAGHNTRNDLVEGSAA